MLAAGEQAGDFLAAPAAAYATDSVLAAPTASLIGRRFGRYQILSLLGRGGMGEVYLAQDPQLDRQVALKLLPADYTGDSDRVRRFAREARAASALNHPNIVTIHEIGEVEGRHFIATEFVSGLTLRERLKAGRPALTEALAIAEQIAGALQTAHEAGIVHRDIKPENVMLRPDGYVKVLDFGLAKLIESAPSETGSGAETDPGSEMETRQFSGTKPGLILGTISYLSPEQARGLEVDARTDIWSLGVVLYELAAGRAPFPGSTASDVIVSILEREPPPLAAASPAAPSDLERIIRRALAKNRTERYPMATDLARDLKKLRQRLETDSEAGAAVARAPRRPGSRVWLGLSLLAVAIISSAAWLALRAPAPAPAPAPALPAERQLRLSLTVQKMRDRRPYQAPFASSGQEIFENGWKFRLNLSSPQAGFFYLLNEGPTAGGATSYHLLYPLASSPEGAGLAAGERWQTGWYVFDENQGTEKFWVVWAARPVPELEAVRGLANPRDLGEIRDAGQVRAVRGLLDSSASSAAEVEKDRVNQQTVIRGRRETLIRLIELEHR